MKNQDNRSNDAAALRQKAEALARQRAARTPEDSETLSPEEIRKSLHELRVHQIELEMQNEELRTAQAEIEAGRARYFDLYNLAPVGYCTLSEKGLILEANLTIATLLGMARGALVKQPISRFILREDQDIYYLHRRKCFETDNPQECELRLVKLDGAFFWALLTATAAQTEDGLPVCRVAISDITGRKRADEALRASEARYRELFENMFSGVAVYEVRNDGSDFIFKDFNRAGEKIDHDNRDRLIGRNVLDVRPGIKEFGLLDVFKRVWKTGQAEHFSARTYKDERIEGWYRNYVYKLPSGEIVTVFENITELKQTEQILRKSEERFQLAMQASHDGLFDWNLETNDIYYSPAWKNMLGYEDHELPNDFSIWENTTDPEDVKKSWELQQKLISKQIDRFVLEFKMKHKDGHWIDVLSRAKAIFNDSGKAVRIVGTHVDITERKRSEAALLTSESRYKSAQEMGHVGSWEYNLTTGLFWGSDEAKRIYGFDPDQDNFSTEAVETCIPERDRVHQALLDLIEKGTEYNLEFQIVPVNSKQPKTIVSLAEVRKDEKGLPVSVVGVIQDITERKQAEAEREKLQAQLSQAQKMESVGRLAGGVAHDFNNMLGIIIGHADMLLEEMGPGHPFHTDLMEIRKAGTRSADLTRQLLSFARKQTVAPKVIDLNKAVEGMLKMLQRLIGEDIDMAWIPGEKVWPVKIDIGQIDQILANLCVNARDAIADVGKVTIETGNTVFDEDYCRVHAGFVPGEYVVLTVSDNGCGMDSGTLSHLFEPFFTTKELGKGTGLGMATVYGVVRQNNGFINVYSEPGQGTTFRIYLPRHRTQEAPLPDKEANRPAARGHETILLVEDEPAILRMTTLMLERGGYAVLAAGTPGEAIRLAAEHAGDIHLLMTDVVMPEMNGRDLAKNVLSLYPRLKCLFMSGYTANVIAHHGVLDEGVNFIQKPFSMGDLTVKVREVLDRD